MRLKSSPTYCFASCSCQARNASSSTAYASVEDVVDRPNDRRACPTPRSRKAELSRHCRLRWCARSQGGDHLPTSTPSLLVSGRQARERVRLTILEACEHVDARARGLDGSPKQHHWRRASPRPRPPPPVTPTTRCQSTPDPIYTCGMEPEHRQEP